MGVDRTELYLRTDEHLPEAASEQYEALLERRQAGEPVQHIIGWAPFYGHRFKVGHGVFIPRFETEIMVARVLERMGAAACDFYEGVQHHQEPVEILDLCCGCGAIGLSIVAEQPDTRVTLLDSSSTALEFARINAQMLGVDDRVTIIQWNALKEFSSGWSERFRYVVANPPYIPANQIDTLPLDVRDGDPYDALTDGGDGLSFYQRWIVTVPPMLAPDGCFLVECGDGMAEQVSDIMSKVFSNIRVTRDLDGIERIVEGSL